MKYSLIVIGAGSGGLVAAEVAATLGARVALVEAADRLGGECLHSGCVPSKALIYAARTVAEARRASGYGVKVSGSVDFTKVMESVNTAIGTIEQRSDNDEHFKKLGVDVFHGQAQFIGKNSIKTGQHTLVAKKFIIATGSSPFVPSIVGLCPGDYLTNETIFGLKVLPKELLVLGGGPIGVELGQAFAMLGSKVTILQGAERLLPREEAEVSDLLLQQFKTDGVRVICNAKVTQFDTKTKQLAYEVGGQQRKVDASNLLIATGRKPNADIFPEAAGIATGKSGITVDTYLRTTNRNVYAVGDCIGPPQFTHLAAEQAGIAVRNALYPLGKKAAFPSVPWVTFTTPEIARVGQSEAELLESGVTFEAHRWNYSEIDRAVAEKQFGFIKILTGHNGHILGATIVGENAGELIAQINLSYWHKLTVSQLALPIQVYPTYGLGIKQLAAESVLKKAAGKQFLRLLLRK